MRWKQFSLYRSELMGIACLWVIYHHNCFEWPSKLYLLKRLADFGNIGVDVFLLLSGIGLYFAWRKRPKLGAFYLRRIVRVLIPYFLLATPYWVWLELYTDNGMFLRNFSMLSLPLNGVTSTWYIGAILVFYVCAPGVLHLMEQKTLFGVTVDRHGVTLMLIFATILACFGLRKFMPEFYDNCEIALTRFAVFVLGVRFGQSVYKDLHVEDDKVVRKDTVLACVQFLFLYLIFRETASVPDIWLRFSFIPVALCVCVIGSFLIEKFSNCTRLRRMLCYFGDHSVELYLSHVLIRNVFLRYVQEPLFDRWRVLDYTLVLLISLLVSEVAHRLSKRISDQILAFAAE